MDSNDTTNDEILFNPIGISRYIIMIIVGFIIVTVLVALTVNEAYEETYDENGTGMGIPMGGATVETVDSVTFLQDGNKVKISGSYSGNTTALNVVLLLSDSQAVYVHNGHLRYFNGTTDSEIDSLTVNISSGRINNTAFAWLYYPLTDGEYRAYDGSVEFDLDSQVAGMGAFDGNVIISMNNTVTRDNIVPTVTVTVERSETGIESITYSWSD